MSHTHRLLIIVSATAAFIIKVCLAWMTFGTNDVKTFELMLERLNTRGAVALYKEGTFTVIDRRPQGAVQMNHPPFSLKLLRVWGSLRNLTGLPLGFWLRLSCAIADLLVLWVLYQLGTRLPTDWKTLLLLALSPATIMISGFHGNTDPLMIAPVVLAVYLIETAKPSWAAGASLGLACSIKIWPFLLLPVLLLGLRSLRRRIEFCAAMGIVMICAAMPLLLTAPSLIRKNVFDYSPLIGLWGLNYLYPSSAPQLRNVMLICVLLATIYVHLRLTSIFARCGIIVALFFFLTPGFGPQYLAWIIPWTLAAGWYASVGFQISASVFLFGIYNGWSGGRLPWYFADANYYPLSTWVLPAGLIPWGFTTVLILQIYRRFVARSQDEPKMTYDPRTLGRPVAQPRR